MPKKFNWPLEFGYMESFHYNLILQKTDSFGFDRLLFYTALDFDQINNEPVYGWPT